MTAIAKLCKPRCLAPFFSATYFGEVPDLYSLLGMFLITGSGMFIFVREGVKREPLAVKTSLRT